MSRTQEREKAQLFHHLNFVLYLQMYMVQELSDKFMNSALHIKILIFPLAYKRISPAELLS